MPTLISINQAAATGIARVRKPIWVTPEDHLEISIQDGRPGLWLYLYAPFNEKCNGRDPVSMLSIHNDLFAKEWLPYDGPVAGSEAYLSAKARYADFNP